MHFYVFVSVISAALMAGPVIVVQGKPAEAEVLDTVSSVDEALDNEVRVNCFGLVHRWEDLVEYQDWSATVQISVKKEEERKLVDCLEKQRDENEASGYPVHSYKILLLRDNSTSGEKSSVEPADLIGAQLDFRYAVFKGRLNLKAVHCLNDDCDFQKSVASPVLAEIEADNVDQVCNGEEQEADYIFVAGFQSHLQQLSFDLYFPACTDLPYERAAVSLYRSDNNDTADCENGTRIVDSREVQLFTLNNNSTAEKLIKFESPRLEGGFFYCLTASQPGHVLCGGQSPRRRPHICGMNSTWVYLEKPPPLAHLIPFCSTHFRCGWIYVTIIGSLALTLSCLLAVCCVFCCCRKKKQKNLRKHHPNETIPFEGLCQLNESGMSALPKKTWAELHAEWDVEPPKNPGKILLLYSPDSDSFNDLQAAFKSFLEEACHCVVLDLFDEELFQTIAFDPELWMTNLLKDPDFKVIVICSEGAFKRHQALLKGEVLNIPDANSTMDGLFSAGLKFITDKHAYDYNRLGLARYEMLHRTSAEFRLQEMVPNREFLVPTQLHDLFCWIHGYDPLDLLGKPWDRYHLELQLLTDSLRKARMEKRSVQ